MKLKTINLLILLSVGIKIAFAQSKISGLVKEKATKQPIIGASIYISELKRGNFSDINGFYKIENIPNGTYLFEISFIGFKSYSERIKIDENAKNVDFVLSESPTELNEVIVTGVTRSTEINQSPVIIKPVDINKLNQSSSTNLIDAIKNIPGVSQISTGASISKPTIRGLGFNRVISLIDGIKQEGQQWGDEHGIEIDEYSVDRIEIVKGPGSLLYGSDGIAGVLNFISPKAPPAGKIHSQFISNYQSNNNLIGYSISNAGNKNNIQWLGRFSNKYAGNYENKYDGKVYNSGFKEYDGSLFVGLNKKWGFTHLNLSSFNTRLNLVEGERDSTGRFMFEKINASGSTSFQSALADDLSGYKIGIPNQSINHIRITSNSYIKLKKGSLNMDLGFQNNKRKEFADVFNPNEPELFFDLHSFNYNLRYNLDQKNGWETTFGVSGMYQQNKNRGVEFIIPEYKLFDIGAFVFTQKTFFEKITLAGGLRVDNRQIKGDKLMLNSLGQPSTANDIADFIKFDAIKNQYGSYSGSAGLSYQIDKSSTLKFNLSRGFRSPNIAEIGSNGKHEGTFRYEIGSPNLSPEISNQIDLGYFLNADHITFEITPFVNRISNYIYTEKLRSVFGGDSIPDIADPTPAFKFVQGNATLIGGEIYLDMHPHPLDWLHIENSFSIVRASQSHQPDSLKYLPFIPAPKYRAELKAQFNKMAKNLTNTYFKVAWDYFFEQNQYFKAYQTETATPSYSLLSAGVGTTIKGYGRKDFINLFINADNLADVGYQSHLSRLKYAPQNPLTGRYGVFNMGRNVSIKMIINL